MVGATTTTVEVVDQHLPAVKELTTWDLCGLFFLRGSQFSVKTEAHFWTVARFPFELETRGRPSRASTSWRLVPTE